MLPSQRRCDIGTSILVLDWELSRPGIQHDFCTRLLAWPWSNSIFRKDRRQARICPPCLEFSALASDWRDYWSPVLAGFLL